LRNGIDCATRINATVAAGLKKAGYDFACRYLVPESYSKALLPAEVKILSDAGLDILSVYETTANRALGGHDAGIADGKAALTCAVNVKQPKGSAIYFAVDFDVTSAAHLEAIEAYLKGAASVLSSYYNVGVYGEYAVIEEMEKRGAAKHFWQTYAWSGGKKSSHANVYQYRNGETAANISVDFNNSFGNEGFWNIAPAIPKKTAFPDVIAGHWAEDAIKTVSDAGVMVGDNTGKFNPNTPLTRAEAAVIVANMLHK
jgi:hypothetical protein